MNHTHLKFFREVAAQQSITKAAEALNVTQPAVTRGIRQLEEKLQVELFDRLPRAMRLTRFGESYLRHVNVIFSQFDSARAELAHLQNAPEEELVIGAGPTWLMGVLPIVLGEFSRSYPNVSIRVRGGYDKQLFGMLERGEVSMVLSDTSGTRIGENLIEEPLIHCEYVVACRKGHPLAEREKVPLSELLNYAWAMPDQAERALGRLQGLYQAESLNAPVPLIRSTSLGFILRFLGKSDALSFVVRSSLDRAQPDRITSVDVNQVLPIRHAGIVRRSDDWDSPAVVALTDLLRRNCKKNPIQ